MSGPWQNINKLEEFMRARPNEPLTTERLSKLTGIPRGSLHGSWRRLMELHPGQACKEGRGTFIWHDPPREHAVPAPENSGQPQIVFHYMLTPDGQMIFYTDGSFWIARRFQP